MAAFTQCGQSWVVTIEIKWPSKLKIFSIWLLTEVSTPDLEVRFSSLSQKLIPISYPASIQPLLTTYHVLKPWWYIINKIRPVPFWRSQLGVWVGYNVPGTVVSILQMFISCSNPIRLVLFYSTFYSRGNWASERWSHLCKVKSK